MEKVLDDILQNVDGSVMFPVLQLVLQNQKFIFNLSILNQFLDVFSLPLLQ